MRRAVEPSTGLISVGATLSQKAGGASQHFAGATCAAQALAAAAIPVVAVSNTEGALIDGRIAAGPVTMTWTANVASFPNVNAGLISSFSSYGLAADLSLKPNIGARGNYLAGNTGINGHEICLEPPPGVEFNYDPNCTAKFALDPAYKPPPALNPETIIEHTYRPDDPCVWSDFDCDGCTGLNGSGIASCAPRASR